MNLLDILANPGVGNLLLLIAAAIGVIGSYQLYQLRLDDRRNSTRRALKAEIESTALLDTWIRQGKIGKGTPAQIIHSTAVYEGHIEDIGLLTDTEIDIISEFYSNAIIINDLLRWNREKDLQISLDPDAIDRGQERRIRDIGSQLDHLAVHRWKAAQILNKRLGESHEPIAKMEFPELAGDTISKYHPAIKSNIDKLVDEGYFESVESDPELYRLTESGEEYFNEISGRDDDYDLDHELSLT